MDFKKLFRKDDKAVSPVIGVILMVAITVILAAAIGSSVFSKGTTESAPQANFDIKAINATAAAVDTPAWIKIEHLGGDDVHFEDASKTKVTAAVNGGTSVEISANGLGTATVGDAKALVLKTTASGNPALQETSGTARAIKSGDTVNIKIIDVQTNQLICDKNVRF